MDSYQWKFVGIITSIEADYKCKIQYTDNQSNIKVIHLAYLKEDERYHITCLKEDSGFVKGMHVIVTCRNNKDELTIRTSNFPCCLVTIENPDTCSLTEFGKILEKVNSLRDEKYNYTALCRVCKEKYNLIMQRLFGSLMLESFHDRLREILTEKLPYWTKCRKFIGEDTLQQLPDIKIVDNIIDVARQYRDEIRSAHNLYSIKLFQEKYNTAKVNITKSVYFVPYCPDINMDYLDLPDKRILARESCGQTHCKSLLKESCGKHCYVQSHISDSDLVQIYIPTASNLLDKMNDKGFFDKILHEISIYKGDVKSWKHHIYQLLPIIGLIQKLECNI